MDVANKFTDGEDAYHNKQTLIDAGPQDEDPLPADGVDPHAPAPPNFHQNLVPLLEEPEEEGNWGDGHWALGGQNQQQQQGA
jgi:hypothetical protein